MDLSSTTLPIFLAISATIFNKVHLYVTAPFIDEVFHLRQCFSYCKHNFHVWDNKITTPPGLYILGTIYSHFLHAFGVQNSCGRDALRSLNLVGGAIVLPLVLGMVRTSNFWKINIVSLPLLYTYYFLFYTDVWSTILVVACLLSIFTNPTTRGAIYANVVGCSSLWFRQTNIVWVAFAGIVLIDLRRKRGASFLSNCHLFIVQALRDWLSLVPFLVNGLFFALFVYHNGGITFGDKENHEVSLHVAQVLYCAAFLAFFTLPVWLSRATLRNYLRFSISGHSCMNMVFTSGSLIAINYIIENYTVVHAFLLADNRHYSFYIYKKLLARPYSRLLLVPAYHFCIWLVPYSLSQTRKNGSLSLSPLSIVAFMASICAILIPSPLFEPRYYIVPLVFFRMLIRHQGAQSQNKAHLIEFLWYSFINTIFFVVFFSYEFSWISEPGLQRIIW